jgi:hypothetical protein
MSEEALIRRPTEELQEYSVEEVVAQVRKVQEIQKAVMKDGEHYGKIPGCGDKPSLLKPGAEKLGFTFRLAPKFQGEREPIDLGKNHREYVIKCELYHIQSEAFFGSGVGSCSTMEAKYRYRTGPKESTGRPVPEGYWSLRKTNPVKAKNMLGGADHSVGKDDSGSWVVMLQGERVEHDNPADHYNTVLKMARKRAHVDAILTATAASDIFTQDIEDMSNGEGVPEKTAPEPSEPKETPPQYKDPQSIITDKQRNMLYAISRKKEIPDDIVKRNLDFLGYKSSKEIRKEDFQQILVRKRGEASGVSGLWVRCPLPALI